MVQVAHVKRETWTVRWSLVAVFVAAFALSACAPGDDAAPGDETARPGDGAATPAEVEQVPLSITSMTSPVDPGDTATVVAQTAPHADCELVYTTPAQRVSFAAGLGSHTADADGRLSWSWRINPATQPGLGALRLTCNGQTLAAVIEVHGAESDEDPDD
jgi:hypothetical protein